MILTLRSLIRTLLLWGDNCLPVLLHHYYGMVPLTSRSAQLSHFYIHRVHPQRPSSPSLHLGVHSRVPLRYRSAQQSPPLILRVPIIAPLHPEAEQVWTEIVRSSCKCWGQCNYVTGC